MEKEVVDLLDGDVAFSLPDDLVDAVDGFLDIIRIRFSVIHQPLDS